MRQRLTPFHLTLFASAVLAVAIALLADGVWRASGLAVVAFTQTAISALGVMEPGWRFFGPTLCQVSTSKKRVALTFDDGPDPVTTPVLLDQLARRGIPVTFFCVGTRVLEFPEICRRAAAEGHQLENHSHEHHRWTNLFSTKRLRRDVQTAQRAVVQATGRTPRFFRPPMGLTNLRVFRVAHALQLRVVGWSARGRDQRARTEERVVQRLLVGLAPGAILVLHDGANEPQRLLRTVELLVDKLEAQGYQCVRLDTLLEDR